MIACDAYTIVGTAGLAVAGGIVLGSFFAAVRDAQNRKDRAFAEKMRSRYGGR